jgi:hypothetical protein
MSAGQGRGVFAESERSYMRFRRRQVLVALACLCLPLTVVAASGAHVRRAQTGGLASAYKQPAPSLFGINTGTFESSAYSSNYKKDFHRARQIGGRWIHITGDSIHWINGRASYTAMNYGIKLAKAQGLGIMLSLGGDPKACSVSPKPSDYTNCPPKTASDFRAYKKFLKQELLHYRYDVTYYESWVEPNHAGRWPPHPNPGQYAKLLKVQYSVFQAVNKGYGLHLKLLVGGPNGFSTAPGSSGGMAALPFIHQVLGDLHGARAFDGAAVHAYRYPPAKATPGYAASDNIQGIPAAPGANGPYPAQGCDSTGTWCRMTWPQELSAYEQEFLNHGYGETPMWLSEFGWPGVQHVPSHPDPSAGYYPLLAEQKRELVAAYNDLLGLKFVQAAFWFNLRDYQPGYPNPDPAFFGHFGLMNFNATLKPAGKAFRQLAHNHPGR